MPTIDQEFNFGKDLYDNYPKLIDILNDMYGNLARAVNKKPDITFKESDPTSTDFRFTSGTIWVNRTSKDVFIMTDKPTQTTANWELLN